MKKLLLAAVVGMLAVTAPVPAQADGPGYTGTCRFATLNDTTPTQTFGGQDAWTGEVNVVVAATDPTATITEAGCWLKVGNSPEQLLLSATTVGPVAAGGPAVVRFTADVTELVYLCTHVAINGGAPTDRCFGPAPDPGVCPGPVCGEGGALDQVAAILGQTAFLDQYVCAALIAAAPAVDSLPTAGVLYVDPVTGDTYAGGTTPYDLIWDCPPYLGAGPTEPR